MQRPLSKEEKEKLEKLAVLRSLGPLDSPDQEEYELLLERADLHERSELEQFRDVAAAMGMSTAPEVPPERVKEQLLESIRAEQFQKIMSDEGWRDHFIEGIRWKLLKLSNTRASVLMEMSAGTAFPHHGHAGDEECYVIRGSLVNGETVLREGDFLFAGKGSSHGPLTAPEGCMIILGLSPEDFRGIAA